MLKNALAPPPTLGAFLAGDLGFLYQYQSGKPMILRFSGYPAYILFLTPQQNR